MKAEDILRKYWGHTAFRLKQEDIINAVIAKKDTLALLPTGAGKSICYQIPTLMRDGICVIISPLISLMADQVRFLSSKGIKSVAITSKMHYNEINTALTNCIYGGVKFLYLSPEKLQNQLILDKITKMNISLITVDEAHCISEWGHSFRPSYRYISKIRLICKDTSLLALTATATNDVVKDIQNNLKFKEPNIIKASFIRKNLSYVVVNTNKKKEKLLQLINKIKSPVIVYVSNRRATKEISDFLITKKYSANYYHAGLEYRIRKKNQEEWINDQKRIIVATSAFGMGINKTNVGLVIHMEPPSTIESYFQEAGRAGRNDKQAYSFLLTNRNDIKRQKKLLEIRNPDIKEIEEGYQNLCNFLQIAENTLPNESIELNIIEFSTRYNTSSFKAYNILNHLEREEYIKISTSNYSKSKVMIKIERSELYQFQINNIYYDNVIRLLLRLYPSLFNNLTIINEKNIASHLKIKSTEVKRLLIKLEQLEIIKYQKTTNNWQVTFLKMREDVNTLQINQRKLNKRKEYEKEKLNSLIDFISNKNTCRSVYILNYFGESRNVDCGKCDYCIRKKRDSIKDKYFLEVSNRIQSLLHKNELSLEEIINSMPDLDKNILINILDSLFVNNKIKKTGKKYQWEENNKTKM